MNLFTSESSEEKKVNLAAFGIIPIYFLPVIFQGSTVSVVVVSGLIVSGISIVLGNKNKRKRIKSLFYSFAAISGLIVAGTVYLDWISGI